MILKLPRKLLDMDLILLRWKWQDSLFLEPTNVILTGICSEESWDYDKQNTFLFVVQSPSYAWLLVTPWTTADQAPRFYLLPRVCFDSCPLSQWCHLTILSLAAPLFLLLSVFLSIRVFSNESALCIKQWKYWSFRFNISPSSEYSTSVLPGLIFFRTDWFDLFAVQGTPKSLLQHHNSKASILWRSAFFIVQFSHLYMTTGKPYFWPYRPLLAKWCLCFLICCLDLS